MTKIEYQQNLCKRSLILTVEKLVRGEKWSNNEDADNQLYPNGKITNIQRMSILCRVYNTNLV